MEEQDEEFDIDNQQNTGTRISKTLTIQRMKEFCYYLVTSVESNLNFCLGLLEDRKMSEKPNSDVVSAISSLINPIPYIGKGLSKALKEGELFIHNKIDQKNSKFLADLVYFFNDNKEEMRKMLIEASLEIFYCFEGQFVALKCEGGARRAMHKLAKDASHRIFTYLLQNQPDQNVTKDDFSKGVLFGDSLKNNLGMKSGKSVKCEEKKWKTSDLYKKVGLVSDDFVEFFKKKETESGKYGYRRLFPWERIEEIREECSKEDSKVTLCYNLKKEDLEECYSDFREYIMENIAAERDQLDRERKHEESLSDRKSKHEELIHEISEQNRQVLDEILKCYEEIKLIHFRLKKSEEEGEISDGEEQRQIAVKLNKNTSRSEESNPSTSTREEGSVAKLFEQRVVKVFDDVRSSGFFEILKSTEDFFVNLEKKLESD